MVQQAYVCGVSTRRVDQLVESLGLRISRSEVSRVCEALDEHVEAFRTRPLEGRYPYLFLDAAWPCGPAPAGLVEPWERPTRISAASAGTRFRPTRTHTTLRDVTWSRPTAVGPAIRSQRASDKMRLVW